MGKVWYTPPDKRVKIQPGDTLTNRRFWDDSYHFPHKFYVVRRVLKVRGGEAVIRGRSKTCKQFRGKKLRVPLDDLRNENHWTYHKKDSEMANFIMGDFNVKQKK